MKKYFTFVVIVAMLASMAVASAEDLGVQVIGGSNVSTQPLSLDDIQLEKTYTIDGYARITPIEWRFDDFFYQFEKDHVGQFEAGGSAAKNPWSHSDHAQRYYRYINIMNSGENADFAWFVVDIVNLTKGNIDYSKEAEVKVVYDDDYEFAGWVRLFNYDYDTKDANGELVRTTLDPENSESTAMMYTAHVVFGCTLPNAVVEDKAPLRMEIKLGDNELIYHIRK